MARGRSQEKIPNPHKTIFLSMVIEYVADVNRQRDTNGLSHAHKLMIKTGLVLDTIVLCEVRQLLAKFQNIVESYGE